MHLLNGLYDAKCDGQPVLAITGHTFHDLIGTHYQQDVDLVRSSATWPPTTNGSWDRRTSQRGRRSGEDRDRPAHVAHITIPKDIQDWSADGTRSKANIPHAQRGSLQPRPAASAACGVAGKRPTCSTPAPGSPSWRARAASRPAKKFLQWRKRSPRRSSKPLLGKAVVPDDHPYTTGGIGLLGTAPSQEVLEECDTLLIAGSSFPYLEFYPKPGQAKAVQIDLDPSRIGLRYPADVGLVGALLGRAAGRCCRCSSRKPTGPFSPRRRNGCVTGTN